MIHEGIPQEVFLTLQFSQKTPEGNIYFHEGFEAES